MWSHGLAVRRVLLSAYVSRLLGDRSGAIGLSPHSGLAFRVVDL